VFIFFPTKNTVLQKLFCFYSLHSGVDVDQKKDADNEQPLENIIAMQDHNEWLKKLVISLILYHDHPPHIVPKIIGLLIAVAESLRALNNFNGCRCIVEGLTDTDVLSIDAWVSLSPKSTKLFDALKDLIEELKTYCTHQQWLQKVSAPGGVVWSVSVVVIVSDIFHFVFSCCFVLCFLCPLSIALSHNVFG
jgi:hypothetical protein